MKHILELMMVHVDNEIKEYTMYIPLSLTMEENIIKYAPPVAHLAEAILLTLTKSSNGYTSRVVDSKKELRGTDVTGLIVKGIISHLINVDSMALHPAIAIPTEVHVHLSHRARLVHIGETSVWTMRGVVTFPVLDSEGTIRANMSKRGNDFIVHDRNNERSLLSGTQLDKLKCIGEVVLSSISGNEDWHVADNIRRVTEFSGDVIELETEPVDDMFIAAGISKPNTHFTPLSSFRGLGYVGKGVIINTRTMAKVYPTEVNGILYYVVEDYLEVKGNVVKFPFDIIQEALDNYTPQTSHHAPDSHTYNQPWFNCPVRSTSVKQKGWGKIV
jgi:hypothetical protein